MKNFNEGLSNTDSVNFVLLQQLLSALDEYDSPDYSSEAFGQLIDETRQFLKLSAREFSQSARISTATYYRWVEGKKGGKPPRHRIEQIKDLLKAFGNSKRREEKSSFKSLRTFDQLLDRQVLCHRQWALKTILPFRAGKHNDIRQRLLDYISVNDCEFNCIFYGEEEPKDEKMTIWPAMHSFGQFKKKLFDINPYAYLKLRGWLVKSKAVAFDLGLSNLNVGLTILEYDSDLEKESGIKNIRGRQVDYFFEVPLPSYVDETKTTVKEADEIGIRWIEWPALHSSLDWTKRKVVFEKILAGKYKTTEIQEFLKDEGDIKKFNPKEY